jgi:DNA (cytosine-5)-methyltransferase 1
MNYYNENDKLNAAWLREAIVRGMLPRGDVDGRSIEDVLPSDLRGYKQCHFFAGIGGWAHAISLASIPPDTELWTGASPCQPFSQAGNGAGFADERHLWPAWIRLIEHCRPAIIFGDRVSPVAKHEWLDLVFDLEGINYSCAVAVLPARSVGAPHIRQRIFWMALANDARLEILGVQSAWKERETVERNGAFDEIEWLTCLDGTTRPARTEISPVADGSPARRGQLRGYGDAIVPQVAAEFIKAGLSGLI